MARAPQASSNPDKVIISNKSGMTAKYTAAGVANIDAALSRLIAADSARGLTTVVVDIDDPAQMTAFSTTPIINAADESGERTSFSASWGTYSDCALLDRARNLGHSTTQSLEHLTRDLCIPCEWVIW